MSILDRAALDDSPLADLHAIASELSIDGYRRLRKAELIDAILARQEGNDALGEPEEDDGAPEQQEARSTPRRRGRRGGRGRARDEAEKPDAAPEAETENGDGEIVEGDVEVLPNGSGFIRLHAPEESDEDVYISAAQVRRCELISGRSDLGATPGSSALGAVRVPLPCRFDQRPAGR